MDRRSWRAVVLALACIAAFGTTRANAAETTGTIVGYVREESGKPIAAATIVAASPSGRYQGSTDARGRFTLVAVSADTYTISTDARGFTTRAERGITVYPGATVRIDVVLVPALHEIGRVRANASRSFTVGAAPDTFTVTGEDARGRTSASGSGLATYARGTVEGAVVSVPGVQQDQFANVIVRGGKVDDVVFSYDAVPIAQAIIAEPGGNVIGAQLPTTGLGYTTLTTGGFASGSDDALGGIVDQVPQAGVFPAQTTITSGLGLVGAAHDLAFERRWATPSLQQRYAIEASVGNEAIRYGDGRSFYPSEAATYGLSLSSRATWSVASNAHIRTGKRDDLELLALAGEATYDQYGTPFPGQTYGAFDGASTVYPHEPSPAAFVTTPTRVRGTYAIGKIQLLRSYDHSYARLRVYQSRYGSTTDAPFFDDLSFPNGAVSYNGTQSGVLTGGGLDVRSFASPHHETSFGIELRRQTSQLAQVVPTLDERLSSNPRLTSALAYLANDWSPSGAFSLQAALRARTTRVVRSDGRRYDITALDPHAVAIVRRGTSALRFAYDHTTVPPKPLQTERFNTAQPNAPFVPLAPERGDSYELSLERGDARARARLTLFSKSERDRIDVIPTDFRNSVTSGSNPATAFGVPQNVGALLANGVEFAAERGPFSIAATYVRARSSSASQFGLNDLNAPAIAANHLFPVGYVPDLTAVATYRLKAGRVTIAPTLSYESGYPYGNGRKVWTFGPDGKPVHVLNDNHVNPGFSYYFLRDPNAAYDPVSNPIVGSLGTPEGDDPNTLRSASQILASLHVEAPLSRRVTLLLDVANLFGTASPTQYGGNPYLIGPPGYKGADPRSAYACWYGQQLGATCSLVNGQYVSSQPYTLGNGVPTNDGQNPVLPWTYGTAGYVPTSYPEARSVYLRLRLTL